MGRSSSIPLRRPISGTTCLPRFPNTIWDPRHCGFFFQEVLRNLLFRDGLMFRDGSEEVWPRNFFFGPEKKLNPYPLPDWHPALSPKSGTRSPPDNAPPTDVATRNAAIPRVVATRQMSNRSRTAAPDPIGAPRVAPGRRPARYPTCGKWEQTACNTSSAAPDVLLTRRGRSP